MIALRFTRCLLKTSFFFFKKKKLFKCRYQLDAINLEIRKWLRKAILKFTIDKLRRFKLINRKCWDHFSWPFWMTECLQGLTLPPIGYRNERNRWRFFVYTCCRILGSLNQIGSVSVRFGYISTSNNIDIRWRSRRTKNKRTQDTERRRRWMLTRRREVT